MYLGTHAVPGTGLKYTGSLFHGEETPVTEHIYVISQPFGSNSRYHLIHNQVNISIPVMAVLGRHGMRPEKS